MVRTTISQVAILKMPLPMVMAAKDNDPDQIIYEAADLWFHIMVLMAHNDLSANDILCELDRRFGVSGVDEKAARATK